MSFTSAQADASFRPTLDGAQEFSTGSVTARVLEDLQSTIEHHVNNNASIAARHEVRLRATRVLRRAILSWRLLPRPGRQYVDAPIDRFDYGMTARQLVGGIHDNSVESQVTSALVGGFRRIDELTNDGLDGVVQAASMTHLAQMQLIDSYTGGDIDIGPEQAADTATYTNQWAASNERAGQAFAPLSAPKTTSSRPPQQVSATPQAPAASTNKPTRKASARGGPGNRGHGAQTRWRPEEDSFCRDQITQNPALTWAALSAALQHQFRNSTYVNKMGKTVQVGVRTTVSLNLRFGAFRKEQQE